MYHVTGLIRNTLWPPESNKVKSATPAEIFANEISAIPWEETTVETCVADCIQSVSDNLILEEWDLSERSKFVVEFYKAQFDKAIDENKELSNEQAVELRSAFNKALCKPMEKKWHAVVVRSFYHTLSISEEKERIAAIQKWTHAYFEGFEYLNERKGRVNFSNLSRECVSHCLKNTTSAFVAYSEQLVQELTPKLFAQAEKDPISFWGKVERALEKKEKEGVSSLSASEAEYVKFTEGIASCLVSGRYPKDPEIEKKWEVLSKCIWLGFSLRLAKRPILDGEMSHNLFREIFKPV
jgi:hypothetical protein